MKKDKKRDIVRSVLPSCARKSARDSSREINRRTRHHVKQALHEIGPEDDYDESEFFGKISKAEARHKSEMKWRVTERRGADKLGPLMRVTENIKRKSKDDSEAHEKLVQLLEPGKNLITRHALGHAEWKLDCPQKEYYLPPETERDKKFRENRYKKKNNKVVWSKKQFKKIIKWLIEHAHGDLNRALKSRNGMALMTERRCELNHDKCMSTVQKSSTYYEIYDPTKWNNWRRIYSPGEYHRLVEEGEKGRIRKITTPTLHHNAYLCANRLLANKLEDYLIISKRLSGRYGQVREMDFSGVGGSAEVLRGIRILVKKYGL